MSLGSILPQAWAKLPLIALMQRIGDGLFANKGAECPFCGDKKKRWGIFKRNGRDFFKCHKPECPANEPEHGHGEIGYLALRKNLSRSEAVFEYLRLAVPELLEEQEAERRKAWQARRKKDDPEEPPEETEAEEHPIPDNPWDALARKLILNPADKERIRAKRGLSAETLARLKIRSNNHNNLFSIEQLREEFGAKRLVEVGLYVNDRRKGPIPNDQFLGYSPRRQDKQGNYLPAEYTEPPLIPYLDTNGRPFYIRPHKGGISKPKERNRTDSDRLVDQIVEQMLGDEPACSSHVYAPFIISDLLPVFDGTLVLTEGEWKVIALYQCGIPAICVPGITFIRNPTFKKELLDLLAKFNVTDLVIMFDNEVKDDPNFPDKYKADPVKRWDTQVWAEYTAICLRPHISGIGGTVRIGWLPNECRNDGKADFDGVLGQKVRELDAPGETAQGTAAARKIFKAAIAAASENRHDHLEFWPSEGRRVIQYRLHRLFAAPELDSGGFREERLANRFSTVDPGTNHPIDEELAEAFRKVRHVYYEISKPDKETKAFISTSINSLTEKIRLHENGESPIKPEDLWFLKSRLAALWERSRGIPKPISTFMIRCEYKLHHANSNELTRLTRLRNMHDEDWSKNMFPLPSKAAARLAEFRTWIYDTGQGVWHSGDKMLQNLVHDMDEQSYMRDIYEIDYYGYNKENHGIWFFGDCAFHSEKGGPTRRIEADEHNIFWHEGIGFQIEAPQEKGRTFGQKAPLLLNDKPVLDREEVKAIYLQMIQDMFDTVGNYEGWLAVGIMLGYGIAPELLKKGGHAGLWIYGKMSGGKTTVARWLMEIWGFHDLQGVSIAEGTTAVGVVRFLSQYSCIPFWFDEHRQNQVDAAKASALRYAFDRGGAGKGMNDNSKRTRLSSGATTPVVTGETGSTDAATRSRYAQVQVAKANRIGDGTKRYDRVQEECKQYFQIGRFIMENREAFAAAAIGYLQDILNDEDWKKAVPNERIRLVHGTAYATMSAMDDLLGTKERRFGEFNDFLIAHGTTALRDVMDETFLNTFWRDISTGLQTGKIKDKYLEVFRVFTDEGGVLRAAPTALDTTGRWTLFVSPAVFNEYAMDKRSRNESVLMDVNSIQREMSKETYFVPLPKAKERRVHRKRIKGTRYDSCWVVSLEETQGRTAFPFIEQIVPHVLEEGELQELVSAGILSRDHIDEQS